MAVRAVLTGSTGVIVVNVSTMSPAVVIVGILARCSGRGGSTAGAIAVAVAIAIGIGTLGLLDDGVFDDFNKGLGINGAACKSLGINGDSFGGDGGLVFQSARSEGSNLLLQGREVGLVLKEECLMIAVGMGKIGHSSCTGVVDASVGEGSFFIVEGLHSVGEKGGEVGPGVLFFGHCIPSADL